MIVVYFFFVLVSLIVFFRYLKYFVVGWNKHNSGKDCRLNQLALWSVELQLEECLFWSYLWALKEQCLSWCIWSITMAYQLHRILTPRFNLKCSCQGWLWCSSGSVFISHCHPDIVVDMWLQKVASLSSLNSCPVFAGRGGGVTVCAPMIVLIIHGWELNKSKNYRHITTRYAAHFTR